MRRPAPYAAQARGPIVPLPSPTGGWNARDANDRMPAGFAIALDNLWPRESDVIVRGGYTEHADTGETGQTVQTLAALEVGTTTKLLAAVNGKLIDCTTSSVSTVGTGYSQNVWNTCVFSGRLFLVNGTDTPLDWTGSTLTATAWTGSGLTIANLLAPLPFKNRLYFIEKNTLNLWYGGVDAVTGALTKFDLAGVGRFGGSLIGIGSITRDGGDGPEDLLALFISTGDVLVYTGTSPAASDWALIGRYRMAAPLNPRSIIAYGGDLIAITREGYLSLDLVMAGQGANPAISDMIRQEANRAANAYAANVGWGAVYYSGKQMLLFNVPRSTGSFDQHVMNTRTGAWARFRRMPAASWAVMGEALYFGASDGKVYEADTGTLDNGEPILCDTQLAWTYLNAPGVLKKFDLVRPMFTAQEPPPIAIGIATDFNPSIVTQAFNFALQPDVGVWDVAIWDQSIWGSGQNIHSDWLSLAAYGYSVSIRIRFAARTATSWQSTQMKYEGGQGF